MNYYILTLFPEMVENGLKTSILGRAVESGSIEIQAINIRDYTEDRHNKVDDYPYGGGAGMLMQAQPIYDAYQSVKNKIPKGQRTRVIYLTPQGKTFSQSMAKKLAKEDNLIFLCGHYEGIDERVLEEIVTDEISLGDYVLTGGELGAMVVIDATSRLVKGVLNNEESANTESFHNNLLEYPQYSRPPMWHNKEVPKLLLLGNHKDIEKWRLEKSIERTKVKRPDLYKEYEKSIQAIKYLMKDKVLNIDMIEPIRHGNADILYFEEDGIIIRELKTNIYFVSAFQGLKTKPILEKLPNEVIDHIEMLVLHQEEDKEAIQEIYGFKEVRTCYQSVYTRGVPLKLDKNIKIEKLERPTEEAIYGAFIEGKLAGLIGEREEGGIGMPEVFEEYRRRRIGSNLECFMVNKYLKEGKLPFVQIAEGIEKLIQLQRKLGFRISEKKISWLKK